jgi:hypothetical protein
MPISKLLKVLWRSLLSPPSNLGQFNPDDGGTKSKKSFPATGLDRPLGFQEVEAPEFLDNRHTKPYAPADFTPRATMR